LSLWFSGDLIHDKEILILIKKTILGMDGRKVITGGTRIIAGKGREELPASYFDDEGKYEKS
jgi:hypothetical protein